MPKRFPRIEIINIYILIDGLIESSQNNGSFDGNFPSLQVLSKIHAASVVDPDQNLFGRIWIRIIGSDPDA